MDLTVERLDGTQYSMSDYNIGIINFKVDSPSPQFNWEKVDGRHGLIDLGTTFTERNIKTSLEFISHDYYDFPLLRNELFKIFQSNEAFYLIDSREPGKRWLVKSNVFSPEQLMPSLGKVDIDFITIYPFAESIGTTLDPFTFDAELWQVGQGLPAEDLIYKHSTTIFNLYNAGIKVDPRYMDLVIEYKGASNNLSIKNETTGDEWTYTGASSSSDVIKLSGVRSEKNGLSIFRNTNKRLITLAEGWNGFRLTGSVGSFEISFKFRFYTL